ncbi:MAG: acetyl-CoA synthetase [Flavobacteriales bacterium]|jgi:acetyl-CoA synthetase
MSKYYHITSFEKYTEAYQASIQDKAAFWDDVAQAFHWTKKWSNTVSHDFSIPEVKWFEGAETNITFNCLDRHLPERADQIAFYWEANDPRDEHATLTYQELHDQVCQYANLLKRRGIKKGDRVAIYMPMIPDLTVALLACARIGAVHSVVFAGFSSQALADRINDAQAVAVLTSDGMFRGAKEMPVKQIVDEALEQCTSVNTVVVSQRTKCKVNMENGRDIWLHEEIVHMDQTCAPEPMDSEDLLFILYTSGSTGKPKGVVHTVGGYMVYAGYSFKNVFQYEEGDLFWCTADVGWITGHTYIVYGPLLNGASSVIFEGIPSWPDCGRFWQICDKYRVNQFYTAPTAIRALMAAGDNFVLDYSLDSLKVIGSVGEPINEEAWNWYNIHVGKEKCPIVDTWWQTETGGILISGLGALSPQKPSHAGLPLPGILPVLLDAEGKEITKNGVEGYLCIKNPWPSMIRTTYGDHERCKNVYFSHYEGYYFTGDGAKRDENGLYRIIGRVDDVINVSGHRFGTAEIESAINSNDHVVESAVVGYPHAIKGQGIYAYVICDAVIEDEEVLRAAITESVVHEIGKIARPDKIQIVPGLPKTRSGKIMRRILRKIAEGDVSNLGDTSTLLDPEVVEFIKKGKV